MVLYFVSLYVYVPGLPAYMAEGATTFAAVGVVLSMYGLWMAVLRMPLGIVAASTQEKLSRRVSTSGRST